eukprot:TRINITY_DN41574_c0_g1_i3.p1 TRINITY_DN41574_c0_g1~~TRINITY_DN41574_c0_g1_i3.p1  ORF type:complete len:412 (+),score=117.86 TRINITY_DN41574_c0_g1_i3:168-1403(+)
MPPAWLQMARNLPAEARERLVLGPPPPKQTAAGPSRAVGSHQDAPRDIPRWALHGALGAQAAAAASQAAPPAPAAEQLLPMGQETCPLEVSPDPSDILSETVWDKTQLLTPLGATAKKGGGLALALAAAMADLENEPLPPPPVVQASAAVEGGACGSQCRGEVCPCRRAHVTPSVTDLRVPPPTRPAADLLVAKASAAVPGGSRGSPTPPAEVIAVLQANLQQQAAAAAAAPAMHDEMFAQTEELQQHLLRDAAEAFAELDDMKQVSEGLLHRNASLQSELAAAAASGPLDDVRELARELDILSGRVGSQERELAALSAEAKDAARSWSVLRSLCRKGGSGCCEKRSSSSCRTPQHAWNARWQSKKYDGPKRKSRRNSSRHCSGNLPRWKLLVSNRRLRRGGKQQRSWSIS